MLMCVILVYGKMGWCVVSWSRESYVNVCYLGQRKDGLMWAILVY